MKKILSFSFLLLIFFFSNLIVKAEIDDSVNEMIVEFERSVKRSEDGPEANWSLLLRQTKRQIKKLNTFSSLNETLSEEQMNDFRAAWEALSLYIEGSRRLFEMGDDPEIARDFYRKALKVLDESEADLKEQKNVDFNIGNSRAELRNLIVDQLQYLEETYGI